jgi:hypothetical protein
MLPVRALKQIALAFATIVVVAVDSVDERICYCTDE